MKNLLQTAIAGSGAEIARRLGISKQGFSSKIRSNPFETVKEVLSVLKIIGKRRQAMMIVEDFFAFVEVEFDAELLRTFPISEIVGKLQNVIFLEIKNQSRTLVLDAWREVQVIAGARVRELTEVLYKESNYGTNRFSPFNVGVPFRERVVSQAERRKLAA